MPLEHALLDVVPGREEEFQAAFHEARELIVQQPGFLWLRLERCVERPSRFLLLVQWDRIEDHTEGFRRSADYERWKELLHHFYDPSPEVLHFVGAQVDLVDEEAPEGTEEEQRQRVREFIESGGETVAQRAKELVDIVRDAFERMRPVIADLDATAKSQVHLWISQSTLRHGVGSEAQTIASAAGTLAVGLLYDNRP